MRYYVTIAMICEHADKHRSSVIRALRQAGLKPEKCAGLRGGRLGLREANNFLGKQWPALPPMRPPGA